MNKHALTLKNQVAVDVSAEYVGNIDSIANKLLLIHRVLQKQDSLAPSDSINWYLSFLVRIVSSRQTHELDILLDPRIKKITSSLRAISGRAECEMEKYWANRIILSENTEEAWNILESFWYYQNYKKLTRFEANILQSNGCMCTSQKKAIFIGGGSLPLTSILMWKLYGVRSTVIDTDVEAVEHARLVVAKLGLSDVITFQVSSGEGYSDYTDIDIVILASLAGMEETEKNSILHQIGTHISSETYVIARSVIGLRVLLYPPILPEMFSTLEVIEHKDPTEEIINCVYLCKKQ